jgi:hypothetical protein
MVFETEYGYFPSTPDSDIFDIYPNLLGEEESIPICIHVHSGKKSVCG